MADTCDVPRGLYNEIACTWVPRYWVEAREPWPSTPALHACRHHLTRAVDYVTANTHQPAAVIPLDR